MMKRVNKVVDMIAPMHLTWRCSHWLHVEDRFMGNRVSRGRHVCRWEDVEVDFIDLGLAWKNISESH